MPRVLLILAVALLAMACAAQDDGVAVGDDPQPTPDSSPTTAPEPTSTPTPPDRATTGPTDDGALPNPVTGTLDRIEVEGGCTVLDVDGDVYELVAAPDARVAIDPANGVIATTEGEVIAEVGDTITVTGEVDTGLMSFCQVGPILAVEDVEVG